MENILNRSRAVIGLVERLTLSFCAVLITVMCVSLLAELVARNIFRTSFIWSMELATICFVWVAFLGGAVAALRKEHFAVDLIYGWFPPDHPMSRVLEVLGHALFVVLGAVFVYYGTIFVQNGMMRHSFSLGIRQGYTMLVVPMAGALFVVHGLYNILALFVPAENRK